MKNQFVTPEIGKIFYFEKHQIFQLKYSNNKDYVIIFLNKF